MKYPFSAHLLQQTRLESNVGSFFLLLLLPHAIPKGLQMQIEHKYERIAYGLHNPLHLLGTKKSTHQETSCGSS